MVKFERLSGLWNYRLSRPHGTFLRFLRFFSKSKNMTFYVFWVASHVFSNTGLQLSCQPDWLPKAEMLNQEMLDLGFGMKTDIIGLGFDIFDLEAPRLWFYPWAWARNVRDNGTAHVHMSRNEMLWQADSNVTPMPQGLLFARPETKKAQQLQQINRTSIHIISKCRYA